ncbi:MAG TPA: GNAT family N-acetyltransferase [Puia sp.]|nr:GNAT family N-acetyltransferase [Puia sp.]
MTAAAHIQTDRLLLRSWKTSDHEPFIRMNQDPRVRKYFPGLLTREESLAHITVIDKNIRQDGYGLFAAELKATGEFIGFIGFSQPGFDLPIEPVRHPGPTAHHRTTPCVEIGWRLAAPFWGQGLATEGATACLETAFQKWGMTDIYSFTSIYNQPSENVMIRIGMTRQGTFAHPSLPADSWLSEHVLYKITKT